MKTPETTPTKEQVENDNLAQVQGYPDFTTAPKSSDSTTEAVQRINSNLGVVYTEEQMDELYLAEMELHFQMVHESAVPEWMFEMYK